ncbi:MAG TPA: hypothetical protein VNW46_17245, partial [Gemmatimonadaceae bacterium]|nr:hypothetical protein [Gemmatimonadaceae bacterium]
MSPRSESLRALRSIPPTRSPSPTARAAAAADNDPRMYADRMFGASAHLVLVDDHGPAVSFTGWKLGAGRAECRDPGHSTRTIDIEVLFGVTGEYAISERIATHFADSPP